MGSEAGCAAGGAGKCWRGLGTHREWDAWMLGARIGFLARPAGRQSVMDRPQNGRLRSPEDRRARSRLYRSFSSAALTCLGLAWFSPSNPTGPPSRTRAIRTGTFRRSFGEGTPSRTVSRSSQSPAERKSRRRRSHDPRRTKAEGKKGVEPSALMPSSLPLRPRHGRRETRITPPAVSARPPLSGARDRGGKTGVL